MWLFSRRAPAGRCSRNRKPPNKRLKLPGPAFRGSVRLCARKLVPQAGRLRLPAFAPQLKRDPLGRGSMWMRMFLALTLALLGCSHRVTRPQLTNRTDRSLVVMTDSMPGGTFPQITDPARAWSHGSLIAASDAPLCVPDLKSRALTWDEVQTPIE